MQVLLGIYDDMHHLQSGEGRRVAVAVAFLGGTLVVEAMEVIWAAVGVEGKVKVEVKVVGMVDIL